MTKSPAYSFVREYVDLEFEKLKREKITPWAFFTTDKGVRLRDYFGKQVSYTGGGLAFEGSPRMYFWNGFIQYFLNDIVSKSFSETLNFCRGHGLDSKLPMAETAFLLKDGIRRIYAEMAIIDQRLRGKGYPDSVLRFSPEEEIAQSESTCLGSDQDNPMKF